MTRGLCNRFYLGPKARRHCGSAPSGMQYKRRRSPSHSPGFFFFLGRTISLGHRRRQRCKISLRYPNRPLLVPRSHWRYWEQDAGTEWTLENIRAFWEEKCLYRDFFRTPEIPEISQEFVTELEPSLKGTPPLHLRIAMAASEPKIWPAIKASMAAPPKVVLPNEYEIVMDDYQLTTGVTHYLAYTTPAPPQVHGYAAVRILSIVPIDILLLAAYCSKLPRIPPSYPKVTYLHNQNLPLDEKGATATVGFSVLCLPTIFLTIPDPITLPILLYFFATHNKSQFVFHILPFLPQRVSALAEDANEPSAIMQGIVDEWSTRIASQCQPWQLAGAMRACKGVWMNLVALGVADRMTWNTLRGLWKIMWAARGKQIDGTVMVSTTPVPIRRWQLKGKKHRIFSLPLEQ